MVQESQLDSHVDLRNGESSIALGQLLIKVKQGDSAAENFLYHQDAERLVRLANRRLANVFNARIDGEDIVQSVFRSFFLGHDRGKFAFDDWNQLWAFLVRVTIRKCNRKVKWMLREKRDVNRDLASVKTGTPEDWQAMSSEPTPQQVAIFEETLQTLIQPLTESQREIVAMRLKGFSNVEIAEKTGRTERTVYRSLGQLRKRMQALEQELAE